MLYADPLISAKLKLPTEDEMERKHGIESIWQSMAWRDNIVDDDQEFGKNERNIVLSMNIDGFGPYSRRAYSIHPIMFMIMNLPENIRRKVDYLILAGIIPGPNAPKNMNTYLNIIVDELIDLWENGMTIEDFSDNMNTHIIKVKLLFTSCDYPAHSSINYQQDAGAYFGCMKCYAKVSIY